jgi:hypothetical protein
VETEKKLRSPNSFRRYDKYITFKYKYFSPIWRHLDPLKSYRNNRSCSTVIEFFNKDPPKNVNLVIIDKKTRYFSESKTIAVHCRSEEMYFPIFSDSVLRHVILGSIVQQIYKIKSRTFLKKYKG